MIKTAGIRRITLIFFYWLTANNVASAIVITVENLSYAGKTFSFYTYSDPVSLEQQLFLTIHLDENGEYSGNVEILKPTYLFCDFGIYRGMLFIEPEADIKLKEAELKLLKAQVHPHFLFNTLNSLYALTLERSPDAPDMVLRLSDMLDYVLHRGENRSVALVRSLESRDG